MEFVTLVSQYLGNIASCVATSKPPPLNTAYGLINTLPMPCEHLSPEAIQPAALLSRFNSTRLFSVLNPLMDCT